MPKPENHLVKRGFEKMMTVFKDSRKNIWVSAADLFLYDKHLMKQSSHHSNLSILDFAEDKNGNVWGISAEGLRKFDHEGNVISRKLRIGRFRRYAFYGFCFIHS